TARQGRHVGLGVGEHLEVGSLGRDDVHLAPHRVDGDGAYRRGEVRTEVVGGSGAFAQEAQDPGGGLGDEILWRHTSTETRRDGIRGGQVPPPQGGEGAVVSVARTGEQLGVSRRGQV